MKNYCTACAGKLSLLLLLISFVVIRWSKTAIKNMPKNSINETDRQGALKRTKKKKIKNPMKKKF